MKILFMDWKSYGNEDIADAVKKLQDGGRDITLEMFPFDNHTERDDEVFIEKFSAKLDDTNPDFVLSFNYHPVVSVVCNNKGIKYASWVYDNPSLRLFSYTLINSCNYVFLFDSQVYEFFATKGFKTVYYLPLAAAVERYDSINIANTDREKWGGKISFIGSLYNEDHNYFDQIVDKLSDYSKGYLEGLMRSQMEISGMDIVEKGLNKKVLQEMADVLGAKPSYDGVETYEYIYSNYVVDRKITSIERTEILKMLGERFPVNLFTKDKEVAMAGVNNRGPIDYYNHMPYVFKTSDINLNITLRSIQRGIPLRVMDILGCGGFLLTNYQADMLSFFEPGKDFVYYESRQDLMDKIAYYLEHEDERLAIAERGHAKIQAGHTYVKRLEEIIDVVTRSQ